MTSRKCRLNAPGTHAAALWLTVEVAAAVTPVEIP